MSYIICSNIENSDTVGKGGFDDPAQFTNHFQSPLIIEANSEVAVESVKIDRSQEWSIKKNDIFFLYYGPEQEDDPTRTLVLSKDVTKNGVRIKIKEGSYTAEGFARAIEVAINDSPIGQEIYGTASVTTIADTNKQFKGFNIQIEARATPAEMSAGLLLSDFKEANGATIGRKANPDNGPPFSYVDALKSLVCDVDSTDSFTGANGDNRMYTECAVKLPDLPLSQNGGEMYIKTTGATGGSYCIGLSRPNSAYVRNGFPSIFTGRPNDGTGSTKQRNELCMMDMWVQYNKEATAGAGKLQIFQWGYNTGTGNWTVKEIKYYDAIANSGVTQAGPLTTAELTTLLVEGVKFSIDGDEVKCSLVKTDLTEIVLIDSKTTAQTYREFNFAPLSNSSETLIPVFMMDVNADRLIIETLIAHSAIPGWKSPKETSQALGTVNLYPLGNRANGGVALIAGSDWYTQAELRRNVADELKYNQLRPSILWGGTGPANNYGGQYTYENYTASVSPYVPVIISGPEIRDPLENDFNQKLYVIPLPNNEANMSRALGFGKWSVIEYSVFGDGSILNTKALLSFDTAEFTVHSAFIRVNDLAVQTYNGNTSSRSNIIYHIPRFTNDGRQFGELYFNAPEKTYLKLNNTEKIMLNQISIDIVGRSERIVDDLTGCSIVTLHIRKARN